MINGLSSTNNNNFNSWGIGGGNLGAGILRVEVGSGGYSDTFYVDSRYIQASPPYGTADGDIPLFCYVEIEKVTGNVQSISVGADPIWAYHGPTDIRGDVKPDGRIVKNVRLIETEINVPNALKAALIANDTATVDNIRNRMATDTFSIST